MYYELKSFLKRYRWRWRRIQSAGVWGRDVLNAQPIVIANAIPKSGSHLLTQVIDGIIEVSPLVDTGMPPINRFEDNSKIYEEVSMLARLREMQAGDTAYSYLKPSEGFLKELSQEKYAVVFIYRDPRDVVVSKVQYATYMNKNHHMHEYYSIQYQSDEDRINAAICGIEDEVYYMSSIMAQYEKYMGWFGMENLLPIRFEDLILDRDKAFEEILGFLLERGLKINVSRAYAIQSMHKAVQPKKSGTFRKGQPGGWKKHFTEKNKHVFKEQTGDLLIRLGYEDTMEW